MSGPESIDSFFRSRFGWVEVGVVPRAAADYGSLHASDGYDVVVRIDGAYLDERDALFNAGLFEQRLMNLGLVKRKVGHQVEDLTHDL